MHQNDPGTGAHAQLLWSHLQRLGTGHALTAPPCTASKCASQRGPNGRRPGLQFISRAPIGRNAAREILARYDQSSSHPRWVYKVGPRGMHLYSLDAGGTVAPVAATPPATQDSSAPSVPASPPVLQVSSVPPSTPAFQDSSNPEHSEPKAIRDSSVGSTPTPEKPRTVTKKRSFTCARMIDRHMSMAEIAELPAGEYLIAGEGYEVSDS